MQKPHIAANTHIKQFMNSQQLERERFQRGMVAVSRSFVSRAAVRRLLNTSQRKARQASHRIVRHEPFLTLKEQLKGKGR